MGQPIASPERRNHIAQVCLGLFLLVWSVACSNDFPVGLDDLSFDAVPPCKAGCYEVAFMVYPPQQRILRGDSLAVSTFSTMGYNDATWITRGSAVAAIVAGGLDSSVATAQRQVWVRGTGVGLGWVRAQAVGTGLADSAAIIVADSSVIDSIIVYTDFATPLRVGAGRNLDVILVDDSVQSYRAMPTRWTLNDSSLATVIVPQWMVDRTSTYTLQAKKPGTVTLTFEFLGVTRAATLTIVN